MADDKVFIEIVLDDGSVVKGFQKVQKQGDKTAKKIGSSFGQNVSKSFKNLTSDVVRLGTAFVGLAGIVKVTRDVVEFGKATAEIRTITQGLNIDQKKLNETLIQASQQFGTTAREQANSFYQIISAGITDASKANEALIAANKLAIGGLTTTTGAVDLLTSAVNAYGQENLSANRAADIIFGTVRLGKTRVEELQSSLGQILPTSSALGVSFEDVAGSLAQLTTKGISTSEAVTQLNAVLTAVLKKQETARQLGPEVAKAFSLQSLQAKGLSKFLKDLNKTLNGSEEALVKLLGRAEGARAIIALAGDDFTGVKNKIDELKTSTGASDQAFKEVDQTLGQQLKRTISIFSGQILSLTSQTEGPLVTAIAALNTALLNLGDTLRFIAIGAFTFITIFKGGAIFVAISTGVSSVIGAIGILQLQLRSTIVTFGALRAAGFTTFSSLTTVMQTTTFAVRALNVATKVLLGTLTLGLTFGIDFIVRKFSELSDRLGGFANVFKALFLFIKIDILETIRDIIGEIIFRFPALAEKIGLTTGTFEGLSRSIGKSKEELRLLYAEISNPPKVEPTGKEDEDGGGGGDINQDFITVGEGFEAFADGFDAQLAKLRENATANFKAIGAAAVNTLGKGVGGAFAAMGKAIVEGENLLDSFLNALLASFGQAAIQLGTQFILQGVAYTWAGLPNGGPLIAAGAALATFGGVLSAIGGGGGASASASGTTGTINPGEDIADEDIFTDDEDFQRQSAVTVNVEGTVLDPVGVGTQIAELLSEVTDSNDIKVNV